MKRAIRNVALLALMTVQYHTCLAQPVKTKPQPPLSEQQRATQASAPTDDFGKRKDKAAAAQPGENSASSTTGGGTTAPQIEGGKRYLSPEQK
ncbi:hypothetical protein CupriaWKF_24600 [Cupriavidus sp. WKF15]|uniref:hypothetical protein n=1 Tax=Cupriavidus sp. WKF15 TaxID=3032282 RepID=UPI0023E29EA8|nr:hypothetical protein [Cupriavidus sp. WKF15]WER47990.1 hypothetical protein CupriaWKF_24600 [Cupriavidus sp. WKF15]